MDTNAKRRPGEGAAQGNRRISILNDHPDISASISFDKVPVRTIEPGEYNKPKDTALAFPGAPVVEDRFWVRGEDGKPIWCLKFANHPDLVDFTTKQLRSRKLFQRRCMQKATFTPKIANSPWWDFLHELVKNAPQLELTIVRSRPWAEFSPAEREEFIQTMERWIGKEAGI